MRALLAAAIAAAAVSAIAGGLLRAGVALPQGGAWLARAGLDHAALMIGCFMGTVIGIERAVALRHRAGWLAPWLSATAGLALLLGARGLASLVLLAAAIAFVTGNAVLLRRQAAPHTVLLLGGAAAWLVGNLLFAIGGAPAAVVPWWFAFLVATIAAERLEMTRLMRRRPGAQATLYALLLALAAGAALSGPVPLAGGTVYGAALALLGLWLLVFDIARRTVRTQGLSRYMAVCLLGGYAWLVAGGLAWSATAWGAPLRDTALHALGLGFILSMMMGHAPVILPAVARIKLAFGPVFYVPLAVLHLSLLARLAGGWNDAPWRAGGALWNAVAIGLFAATVGGTALAWRRRHGGPTPAAVRRRPMSPQAGRQLQESERAKANPR